MGNDHGPVAPPVNPARPEVLRAAAMRGSKNEAGSSMTAATASAERLMLPSGFVTVRLRALSAASKLLMADVAGGAGVETAFATAPSNAWALAALPAKSMRGSIALLSEAWCKTIR